MAEQEVRSPVSRPSGKVGSGQPMSPGARQQSIPWRRRLYFRAAVIWSKRPQRGAGKDKDCRPRGVSLRRWTKTLGLW